MFFPVSKKVEQDWGPCPGRDTSLPESRTFPPKPKPTHF